MEQAADFALPGAATRRIRHDVARLFFDDAREAERNIDELVENPEVLVGWATEMIRRNNLTAEAFRWEEVPAAARPAAARGLAMAYLLYTLGPKRETSSKHAEVVRGPW